MCTRICVIKTYFCINNAMDLNLRGGEEAVTDDPLCGLVVRVPGYRASGPGSIPGPTRLSEK
jgi:hypothetical protein